MRCFVCKKYLYWSDIVQEKDKESNRVKAIFLTLHNMECYFCPTCFEDQVGQNVVNTCSVPHDDNHNICFVCNKYCNTKKRYVITVRRDLETFWNNPDVITIHSNCFECIVTEEFFVLHEKHTT